MTTLMVVIILVTIINFNARGEQSSESASVSPLALSRFWTSSSFSPPLNTQGESEGFPSTLARELAFATHHAIHHHAIIKMIATSIDYKLPSEFGVAPSTQNFIRTSQP